MLSRFVSFAEEGGIGSGGAASAAPPANRLPIIAQHETVVGNKSPSERVGADAGGNVPDAAVHQADQHAAAGHGLQARRIALLNSWLELRSFHVLRVARVRIDRVVKRASAVGIGEPGIEPQPERGRFPTAGISVIGANRAGAGPAAAVAILGPDRRSVASGRVPIAGGAGSTRCVSLDERDDV